MKILSLVLPLNHILCPTSNLRKVWIFFLVPVKQDQAGVHFEEEEMILICCQTHGILYAMSWGTLMPTLRLSPRLSPPLTTSYSSSLPHPSSSAIGVVGWGTGLKLGSDLAGVTYNTHRALGITLFCLGTLQVFALLLRPNKDHKIRIYWNFYHYVIGYATIIINIINIFKGFEALEVSEGDRYNDWKHAYIGIIAALGGIVVLLEA
ncbi:hypothetical protein LR48_Vigan11g114900 [Vigna angularis]|uniref:Cytochrome b561 domain-containing protein n=1 Tax=Phaseolus angularis TaxID=3914 RepID=A0A0L9VSS0_PHAAN|nr:hypothetical protein LR48_Vigan11g114900 [Vigna angularis]